MKLSKNKIIMKLSLILIIAFSVSFAPSIFNLFFNEEILLYIQPVWSFIIVLGSYNFKDENYYFEELYNYIFIINYGSTLFFAVVIIGILLGFII